MTNNQAKMGFTLIELLVVVLIIGILAAVALPQYQLTVDKARLTKYFPFIKALIDAQEVYYMENGYYAGNLEGLDLDVYQLCKSSGGSAHNVLYNCPDPVVVDVTMAYNRSTGNVLLYYCPTLGNEEQTSYVPCAANNSMQIVYYFQRADFAEMAGKKACFSADARGERLCKSITLD